MKNYLAILVAMLALASIGASQVSDCSDGTCDYNFITQTNTADAESGEGFICDNCWLELAPDTLKTEQEQTNCAAVLGNGNTVIQSSVADSKGTAQKELQNNVAMVVGSSNYVSQSNNAVATGIATDGAFGIYETQIQKNMMLIIGTDNRAEQTNIAKAKSDSPIYWAYPTEQNQKNVGLILGAKNRLYQTNDAEAVMQKFIEVDPKIKQIQKNIAFAVNNCEECAVDTSFADQQVTWPSVSITTPQIPSITCPEIDCETPAPPA